MLHESKGCSHNSMIMREILTIINESGGEPELTRFLLEKHPEVIMKDRYKIIDKTRLTDEIFGYYNPSILTFPRRIIIEGKQVRLKIEEFIKDKLKYDYIILGDKAYIEYLIYGDKNIVEKIPDSNWKIREYRNGKEKAVKDDARASDS